MLLMGPLECIGVLEATVRATSFPSWQDGGGGGGGGKGGCGGGYGGGESGGGGGRGGGGKGDEGVQVHSDSEWNDECVPVDGAPKRRLPEESVEHVHSSSL